MRLTESDRGRTVEVEAGAVVTVLLRENPSTGYRWTVDMAGDLEQITDRANPGEAMGGAGTRELQFRAAQRGTHEVHLKNWRSWEGDASVRQRWNVTIVVT